MSTLFRSALLALALVAGLPLAGSLVSSAAATLGLASFAATADTAGAAEAAFIRRNIIKQSPSSSYRVIVVVGDDSITNEVSSVKVSLTPTGGSPVPSTSAMTLPLKVVKANGNKRYVFADVGFSSSAVGFSYNVVSTMLDAAGAQVGSPLTSVVAVTSAGGGDAEEEITIRGASIAQVDATNFLVQAVVTDAAGVVGSVDVTFVDYSGPAPLPKQLTLTNPIVVRGTSIFSGAMTFADATKAVNSAYTATVDLKDTAGASIGYMKQSFVIEGMSAQSVTDLRLGLQAAQLEADAANATIDTLDVEVNGIVGEIEAAGIVLPPHTQVRVVNTVQFIDDWQGE